MGLNDLHLSPSIIAALYPSSLIIPDQTDTVAKTRVLKAGPIEIAANAEENTEPDWKYLGHNKKNILVIVSYTDAVHLPDEELAFLTNMLSACKLNLGDVAIVNKHAYRDSAYKNYMEAFKPKTVFLFGVEPSAFGLPVSFPYFQVQAIANCTFLYTPPLEQQRQDALLKSKLWVSLRSIFSI
jgi:hypothetical protein